MSLPCLAGREAVDTELSLLAKGIQLDRNAGYTIDQIGTALFRVTFYGQDGAIASSGTRTTSRCG